MDKTTPDATGQRRHRREKATIDHMVDRVFDPAGREKVRQSPTTQSGASVETQVRKEWDPKKSGLPIFVSRRPSAE